MHFPSDFSSWIGTILPILVFLATTFGLLKGVSRFAAHSVCLSGQRIRNEEKRQHLYRLAIQNNEDACLTGNRKLTIAIHDDGRFLPLTEQRQFVGLNHVRGSMTDERTLSFRFEELPAFDTWTFECTTDSRAWNLSVTIEDAQDPAPAEKPADTKEGDSTKYLLRLPAVLSHTRLNLSRSQESAFIGAAYLPEIHWAMVATVLIGILPYSFGMYLWHGTLDRWDALLILGLSAFGWGLWGAIRRHAPSIAQGYWEGCPVAGQPESSAPAVSVRAVGQ